MLRYCLALLTHYSIEDTECHPPDLVLALTHTQLIELSQTWLYMILLNCQP